MKSSTVKRPPTRYHGGKWRQAESLIALMPAHDVYVEPFGGMASVLLQKPRVHTEVYNDLDSRVVNLFRVLRDPLKAERLRELVHLTPFSREDFESVYHGEPTDDVDAAYRMCILGAMGFGSDSTTRSCRTGFRVKVGSNGSQGMAWHRWPDHVASYVERLRGVIVENADAFELIPRFDSPVTVFYVDPPYVASTRSSLRGRSEKSHGYRHELTDEDHDKLAELLHTVKGTVLLSGYHSPLYDRLYADWHRQEFAARADGNKPRTEVVWMNHAPRNAQLFAQ
jgi:DNA adenine methylase